HSRGSSPAINSPAAWPRLQGARLRPAHVLKEMYCWQCGALPSTLLPLPPSPPLLGADSRPQLHYIGALRGEEVVDVPTPRLERGAALVEVLETIVDRGDAFNRAASVVQHAIDDVRGDIQPCHAGGRSAAQIV